MKGRPMDRLVLQNDFLRLEYLKTALRITGLFPAGKPNLLADLSEFPPIPTPYGNFHFHGGHRLWHAPEAMPRTYIPDMGGLEITDLSLGVRLETQPEPGTRIRKQIEIQLAEGKPSVTLTHTLVNDGLWPVQLAPWAITQFRLGGTVILPMPTGNVDAAGLLPNRQLAFWPYSHIKDPRLDLGDAYVLFKAEALPPFKMGYLNPHGWMAYWMDGVLFRKTFEVHAGQTHPDNNCNTEIFCNAYFVELESLAPLTLLAPGESVSHVEVWEVFDDLAALPQDAQLALSTP
jgi:hypothetical protein